METTKVRALAVLMLGGLAMVDRWWILLSDVLIVGNPWPGIWTVYHFKGTVINIPASAISKEQLEVFCSAVYRATQGHANINWDFLQADSW